MTKNNVSDLEMVRLNIQLTKKCNQRCKSCNSYELDSSDEMTTGEIKRVIKEVCVLFPIKNIAFTGGEPTLHKDILELAGCARKYSSKVSVTTNGYYCSSKERTNDLVDAGINRFSFSYHGVGKQDDFCGMQGSEMRIRQAIDWLLERKTESPELYIKVGTLFDGRNIDDVEEVLKFTESKKLDLYIELLDKDLFLFKKAENIGYTYKTEKEKAILNNSITKIRKWKQEGKKVLLDYTGIQFINDYFESKLPGGYCPLGYTDIFIESNGNVRTGCWQFDAVGNIREYSVNEIVNSTAYKANINKMLHRQCKGCTCGYLMQAKFMEYE